MLYCSLKDKALRRVTGYHQVVRDLTICEGHYHSRDILTRAMRTMSRSSDRYAGRMMFYFMIGPVLFHVTFHWSVSFPPSPGLQSVTNRVWTSPITHHPLFSWSFKSLGQGICGFWGALSLSHPRSGLILLVTVGCLSLFFISLVLWRVGKGWYFLSS